MDPENKAEKRKISIAEYQRRKKSCIQTTPKSKSNAAIAQIGSVDAERNDTAEISDAAVQTVREDLQKVIEATTQCTVTTTITKQTTYPDGRVEVVTATHFDRPPTKDTWSQTVDAGLRHSPTTLATIRTRRERDTGKTWDRKRRETEHEDELSDQAEPKERCNKDSRPFDSDTTTEEGTIEEGLASPSD